jgi:hypothetical protein
MTATLTTATLTSTEREALAQKVASAFAKLADHKKDIERLCQEFAALKDGETIMGCTTKTEFCDRVLGRSIRAVRYMLDGGNHNRQETVSPAPVAPSNRKPWTRADEKRKNRSEPLESEEALRTLANKLIDAGYKTLLEAGENRSHLWSAKEWLKGTAELA